MNIPRGGPSFGRNFDVQGGQKTGRPQAAVAAQDATGGGGGCHGGGAASADRLGGGTDSFQGRGIFSGSNTGPQAPIIQQKSTSNPFISTTQGAGTNGPATTGGSAVVTDAEILQATKGDQKLAATLRKVVTDPEGAKVVRDALDRGTTYVQKQMQGSVAGLTHLSSGSAPFIEIDPEASSNLSVLAHESAHAAYPDMDHTDVYNIGYRVSDNLGVREPRVPGYENIQ
jgi:hypothetical protein